MVLGEKYCDTNKKPFFEWITQVLFFEKENILPRFLQ